MMTRWAGWSALLLAIALGGCQTTERFDAKVASWLGKPLDQVVLAWGPPDKSYTLSNGGKVVEYNWSRIESLPGMTYTAPPGYYGTWPYYGVYREPDTLITLHCEVQFTTDPQGKVIAWKRRGNDCVL